MANNPVQIQNETRIGDGKALGNIGQKATISFLHRRSCPQANGLGRGPPVFVTKGIIP